MSKNNQLATHPLKLRIDEGVLGVDSKKDSYVVAVSGGVDSVVLLDLLAKWSKKELIVAHVHHGIRRASDEEYEFVKGLAKSYGLKFESTHLELGDSASELIAREGRYAFLRKIAKQYNGMLVTAHHADDVIETIALNIQRGTGWRGLAVMGSMDIWRPLTWWQKTEIINYANANNLEWREDESNTSHKYARNCLRPLVAELGLDDKLVLLSLWHKQRILAGQIDSEVVRLLTYDRHFYIMADLEVAQEVLRARLLEKGIAYTRPQINLALLAIKTARPGAKFSLNSQFFLQFSKNDFRIVKRQ